MFRNPAVTHTFITPSVVSANLNSLSHSQSFSFLVKTVKTCANMGFPAKSHLALASALAVSHPALASAPAVSHPALASCALFLAHTAIRAVF